MNQFYSSAKSKGLIILLGALFFILQGCSTPLVNVDVKIDGVL